LNNNFIINTTVSGITVSDLDLAIEWYCKHLGMKLLARNPYFATMQVSPGQIIFLRNNQNEKDRKIQILCTDLCFIVTEIEELYSQLKNNHIRVTDLEVNNEDINWKWFYFYDPDGNCINVWTGTSGWTN